IIQASSESASSTVVGSIMDISPNNESSSLKLDLVLLGLSLLPMISSSGCEDLYLNVFLGSKFSSGSVSISGLMMLQCLISQCLQVLKLP
ncbi:hypothetical protein A2U01_0077015, partial [Trifolium medium]|nr:hypothetical protein [Trifolium medium]